MKKVFQFILAILMLSIAYLFFWPNSLEVHSWDSPINHGYVDEFESNQLMQNVEIQHKTCAQCEDVAIDKNGNVFGASIDGRILRFDRFDGAETVVAHTDGRPLGLDFDHFGQLYIADAIKGLMRIDSTGRLETLSTAHNGRPYIFTDDLEVGSDGKVYFTDASETNNIHLYKLDILAHSNTGRLLVFDPQTKQVDMLLEQLYFANGVATSSDSSFILVNETTNYRVLKYYLKGDKKGQTEVFIDNLPGFPDGISSGSDGIYWLTLISPRNPIIDKLSDQPFIRKSIARLPEFLQPAPERYAAILGLNQNGEVVYNFQKNECKFSQISSVQQWKNDLYFGSLGEAGVGILKDFKNVK